MNYIKILKLMLIYQRVILKALYLIIIMIIKNIKNLKLLLLNIIKNNQEIILLGVILKEFKVWKQEKNGLIKKVFITVLGLLKKNNN